MTGLLYLITSLCLQYIVRGAALDGARIYTARSLNFLNDRQFTLMMVIVIVRMRMMVMM